MRKQYTFRRAVPDSKLENVLLRLTPTAGISASFRAALELAIAIAHTLLRYDAPADYLRIVVARAVVFQEVVHPVLIGKLKLSKL
jgi:hypothetical protein